MTPKQRDVLQVIQRWQAEYRNSPLKREIAREAKVNKSSVNRILFRLSQLGYIDLVTVGRRWIIVPIWKEA